MSIILPSTSLPSPTKLTPHEALVKFGEDLTQRASQVPVSNDSTDGIEPASSLKEMLLKSQTGLNDNTVEVFKTSASKQRFSVRVFQDSGFPVIPSKSFKEVHHFDPKTLKDQSEFNEIAYEDVAYINQFKQYITPLAPSKQTNTIEIFQISATKQRASVLVDCKSGYMIETREEFQYIFKFDPSTFSQEKCINVNDVGYWNKYNIYIKPKTNHLTEKFI